LYNEYNINMWRGVRDAAWEREANLIYFPGGMLYIPDETHRPAEVLYDLVSAETLDGLVIWGAQLAHYVGPGELSKLCERYRPLPIVNIGLALEGVPSLLVDNYQGMYDVVTHLIEVHGYRRIAFICGPEDNIEAQERYHAYADALTGHGIPFDPAIIVSWHETADLHRQQPQMVSRRVAGGVEGEAGIRILLDERRLLPGTDFDAVVGHSDAPTLDALDLLQARGARVPDDVAVASFDDIEESRYITPPLTTARQSFYDLGAQATEMLLALLAGEEVSEQVILPMEVIVRRSCGCKPAAVEQAAAGPVKHSPKRAKGKSFEEAFTTQRARIFFDMVQAAGVHTVGVVPEWAERLLDNFAAEVRGRSPGLFLSTLEDVLRQVTAVNGDIAAWQGAVSALRRHTLPYLGNDEMWSQAEDLWQQARVLIGETAQRVQGYKEFQAEQQDRVLREIGQTLITTFDVRELMDALAAGLPRLGVPGAYLSLYENPEKPTEWSRLILAYNENGRVELEPGGQRFPSRRVLPEEMWPQRQYSFVVEPLYFRENQLGFALFEVGPREGGVYEALRWQISSALQGALLLRARQQVEEELVRSNADLEQFAYVASHDLQEPLRMVRSYLQLLERRYKGRLDSDADEFIAYAVDGATRMQTLIHDLLTYSRVGTRGKPFQSTNCAEVLKHVLTNLAVAIEESRAVVTYDVLPTVIADDVQLAQLFQNLIGNAIKFRSERDPEVHVGAEHRDGEWQFSVRDNGIGIDPQHFGRLFTVLQRLHTAAEYPGTGIGLAVCKKIVERHGGRIWVESQPGKGASFYFTIPDERGL
jgi:signal transduction histidine kinase/DNA-binding LacI/PurR family transcriptional regulator